jgi:hypothetical protein
LCDCTTGLPALIGPTRLARPRSMRWKSIALTATTSRNLVVPVAYVASALAGALVTWLIAKEPIVGSQKVGPVEVTSAETVGNETVVYQRPRPPDADQDYSVHSHTEQIEASDQNDDDGALNDGALPNFARSVQTVRFVPPGAPATSETPEPRGLIREALAKIGGFVASRPKEDGEIAEEKRPTLPRKRGGSIMDEVDDYLWEVYQRVPIKKDGTGDFTWKDPAAAKHMGLSMQDYVIGGMDPDFREQLYHAGRAMDAAGLQWSMLSAFRDDYRQGLASGYKAGVSNSLHGGSRRTGGYGYGRAVDITGPDGREEEVWKWVDNHGAKYGLHRPLPKADPAHVQQRGDWNKIALALRESRTRSATGEKTKVAAADRKARARKSAVASAR